MGGRSNGQSQARETAACARVARVSRRRARAPAPSIVNDASLAPSVTDCSRYADAVHYAEPGCLTWWGQEDHRKRYS
eukprot:1936512-Prymnesium_polylepis.1